MPDRNKPEPVETLRDGRLKATIWENQNENGSYHSVSLAKTYEDKNGRLQDSHSFTGSELLRIAELARESHSLIRDLRRERSQDRNQSREATAQQQEQAPKRFRNRNVSR